VTGVRLIALNIVMFFNGNQIIGKPELGESSSQ